MLTRRQVFPQCALAVLGGMMVLAGMERTVEADDVAMAELPAGVKRVLFLGDSITYAGQYTVDVEAYLITRYPKRRIEFVNVGLPSETTSGLSEAGHAGGAFPRPVLSERLGRVLDQVKPDFVFACYGMNDGIYLPFDEARFKAFQDGITAMRAAVIAAPAEIVLLTPPYFDGLKFGNMPYVDTLDRYSKWLLDQRSAGWRVIDVHGPMTAYVDDKRRTDAHFGFADDGVHPNDLGHWIMAKAILVGLGAKDLDGVSDAAAMARAYPNGEQILALVRQREDLMKDAWLTATGHKRPGMAKGLPLAEAEAKAAKIQGQIDGLTTKT